MAASPSPPHPPPPLPLVVKILIFFLLGSLPGIEQKTFESLRRERVHWVFGTVPWGCMLYTFVTLIHHGVTAYRQLTVFSDGSRQWFASNLGLLLFLRTMQLTDVCCWLHIYILGKLENQIADIQTTLIPISREPNLPSLRS